MSGTSLAVAVVAILVASTAFSATGQGGGVLYVPILLAFGMSVHDAATISLFVIIATSISAAIIYRRRRTIDWKLALVIEPMTFALAFAGGLLANYIDAYALKIIFGAVLIVASFFMMRPATERETASTETAWSHRRGHWLRTVGAHTYVVRLPWLMPVTAVAGFIAGMIGISGGIFKMPAMVLLGGVPMRIAIGTSSFMVALTALGGLSGHLVTGSFDILAALPLAAAAFVGGRLGSSLSVRVRPSTLRTYFAVLLVLIAIWMIVGTVT